MTVEETKARMTEATEALREWAKEKEGRSFLVYLGDANVEKVGSLSMQAECGDETHLEALLAAALDNEESFLYRKLVEEDFVDDCEEDEECTDEWFGEDKVWHFAISVALTILHPLIGIGMAIGKELHDMNTEGNHWCWKDMVADLLGIGLGVGIRFIVGL